MDGLLMDMRLILIYLICMCSSAENLKGQRPKNYFLGSDPKLVFEGLPQLVTANNSTLINFTGISAIMSYAILYFLVGTLLAEYFKQLCKKCHKKYSKRQYINFVLFWPLILIISIINFVF